MSIVLENGNHLLEGGYWNANESAVAIVAVVTPGIDWAAYIGGTSELEGPYTKEETLRWVAHYGCKLSEATARPFFDNRLADMVYRP